MGLQKYRADIAGEKQLDGAIPYYTKWIGGPTLALIKNCRITGIDLPPRTVYITGEPETFFSLPAACRHRGKTIRGYVTCQGREYYFVARTQTPSDNK